MIEYTLVYWQIIRRKGSEALDNLDRDQVQMGMDVISRAFLALHLILLFLFFVCGSYVMIVVSLVTVIAVVVSFRFAKQEKLLHWSVTIYAAQLVELIFTAIFTGFTGGLQVPLLALTLFIFFCEYVGRTLEYDYMPSIWAAGICAAVYILFLKLGFYEEGVAPLPEKMTMALHLVWDIPMFLFAGGGVYLMVHLVTYSERILTDQANTDKLTGLINRAGYDQLLTHINIKTTTLLVFDADKFKVVNDTYGHEVGDLVLKKIARVLKQNFRLRDCVCRIGGDEFVVLMLGNEMLEQEQIVRKVSRINRELSHNDDKLPIISLSCGIAYGVNEKDWKTMFNHADQCMYQVKQAGGRGCRFYS